MPSLPTVGGDSGVWGTELNAWLLVAHNSDGTLNSTTTRIFNVADYGAVPDAYFTDGVVNATTTFTSATAAFTAADVGKFITILNAGASRQDAHSTTIASVSNGTTVILTDSAGRSRSACRFYIARSGDQTTAIQNAINAATAAGGGTVYLPGVGYAHTGLNLKHHVWIRGAGIRATTLRLMPGSTAPSVRNDWLANDSATFTGVFDLTLLGARKRQTAFSGTLGALHTSGDTTITVGTGQGASLLPFGVIDIQTTATITAATNATPISVTATAHGYSTGNILTISGVLGNTNTNGKWAITVIDANTFTLDGSAGNAAYTSGGTANRPSRFGYVSKSGDVLTLSSPHVVELTPDANFANGKAFTQARSHGVAFYSDPLNGVGTSSEWDDSHHILQNVFVYDHAGDGITHASWGNLHCVNVDVEFNDCVGVRPSFDSFFSNMNVGNSGRSNFVLGQAQTHLSNCTSYSAGNQNQSTQQYNPEGRGYVIDIASPATDSEGMWVFSSCTAQDNSGDGFCLSNPDRALLAACTASSNSKKGPVGAWVGCRLLGAQDCIIDIACVERRVDGVNSWQANALYIDSATQGSQIRVTHGAVTGATVGTVIKSGSVLTGGNSIQIGGMGGTLSPVFSATPVFDPYLATTHVMGVLTAGTVVGVPANAHYGCSLTVVLQQDGTGGRTIGWNAIFKNTPTTVTAINGYTIGRFVYDGTNWVGV